MESVFHLAGCCEMFFLYHGEDSQIIHHCCPGLFMLLSSPVHSVFLRMYQTVDLATPNASAVSLMDLF